MKDIRVPLSWLEEITKTSKDINKWSFTSAGGNTLSAKKVKCPSGDFSIDFEYNPED